MWVDDRWRFVELSFGLEFYIIIIGSSRIWGMRCRFLVSVCVVAAARKFLTPQSEITNSTGS